jgi:integrase
MQGGSIRKHHGSWTLFYYDQVIRGGQRKRVLVSRKLAAFSEEYPSKTSVRPLADAILGPLNRKQVQPESSLTIKEYIESHYFPGIERELRPSTVHNYRVSIYGKHLKSRLGSLKMRDARPVHFQRMLRQIPDVGHLTLLHIKNFLSGVFRFARREGVLDGQNPLLDVTVPGRAKKFEGAAYTLDEVERMLEDLEEHPTASDVVALMSLTGLRQSEARGLRWSDWDETNQTLMISRSVWGSRVGPTKNPESEARIPVLPLLADLLARRRERVKPRPDDYVFAGPKWGAPLDFHNLVSRVIRPALLKSHFVNVEGEIIKGTGIEWKGWHGFRRGLATNLFDLGVHPKLIAGILRHSDVQTTMKFYIKERDTETRAALAKFESAIRNRPSGLVHDGKEN